VKKPAISFQQLAKEFYKKLFLSAVLYTKAGGKEFDFIINKSEQTGTFICVTGELPWAKKLTLSVPELPDYLPDVICR